MADLKSIIAPTEEQRSERLAIFKQYVYYGLIGLICLIVLFIVPIISGGVNAEDWDYWMPTDFWGWFAWWALKIGTVFGNLAVFGLFKAQGKTNCLKNPNYLKANELLKKKNGQKGFIPQSPVQYQLKTWSTKGVSIAIITAAECVVVGSLIISWDLITFISCFISTIIAIIFGIVQMIKDEVYWTDGYLAYAEYVTKTNSQEEKEEE